MQNILRKITKTSIYLLIFLMPLFFLSWTSNILAYNKQVLLVFLTFVGLFSWLLDSLIQGKITINTSKLNIPIIVFLIVVGISTWFSSYRYGSFWGWPLDIPSSFLTTLCFVMLYFLIINVFKKKDILGVLFWLVMSGFLAALMGGLHIFGQFPLPFDFSKVNSFNTIGTINALGIFLGVMLSLFLTMFFISKRIMKFLMAVFSFITLLILLVINFSAAWLVLLLGSIVILVFGISKRETFKTSWLVLPMIFLAISVFFGVFKISVPGLPATPLEVSPSYTATINIVKQALQESPVWGSGPGTFVYNYSKFKSETINQTAFWAVRFSAGSSDILNRVINTGVLGLLSFLAILIMFFVVMIKKLIVERKEGEGATQTQSYDWIFNLGIFASWLSVVGSMFLYPSSFCLLFMFWILSASFVVLTSDQTKTWALDVSSTATISTSLAFVLVFILTMSLFFMEGLRYLAEIKYQDGITAWQNGNNTEAVASILASTSYTSGKQDNYWRDLSQIYLLRVAEEIQKEDLTEEESNAIAALAGNAINSAKLATDAAPKSVANWTVRGFIYRQLVGVMDGAGDWALTSYEEAVKLEPTNPYLYTEMGRVYLAQEQIDLAKEKFQKALDLKSDYAQARFQMALSYVAEENISQAIVEMEDAKKLSPNDVGVTFQLGLLYYYDDQLDKAKEEFNQAIAQNEDYSNARYFLGLVLDKEGKKDEAISQFEKIQELNPGNQQIESILANLKAGKEALEGLVQTEEVPIEETPEEVLD